MHASTSTRRFARTLAAWPWLGIARWLSGVAVGGLAVLVLDRLRTLVGHTPEATAAVLLTIGLAVVFRPVVVGGRRRLLAAVGLVGVFWLLGPSSLLAERLLAAFTLETLSQPLWRWATTAAIVGPVVGLFSWLAFSACGQRGRDGATLAGAACGGLLLIAVRPFASAVVIAVACGGALTACAIVLATFRRDPSAPREDEAAPTRRKVPSRLWIACGLGALAACLTRELFELVPATAAAMHAVWAAVLLGIGAGSGIGALLRKRGRPGFAVATVALAVAAWGLAVVALHVPLARLMLHANAFVETVPWLVVLRTGFVVAVLLPVGLALAVAVRTPASARDTAGRFGSLLFGTGAVAGAIAATRFGVATAIVATAWWLIVPLVARVARGTVPGGWPSRIATALAAGVVLAGPVWTTFRAPAVSARLLYSGDVIGAVRGELPADRWTVLDERRCVAERPGPFGAHTVWSHHALQRSVRTAGIPAGVASVDADIAPQHGSEAAAALLPLVLHEAPRHVLLLGAGSGVGLSTTLAFPVQSVTCVEADASLVAVLQREVWSRAVASPFEDERLRVVALDPNVAAAVGGERFDVVIGEPAHPSLARAATRFTRDFYRRAAGRLAEGGVFCQRLRAVDFGPEAVAEVLAVFSAEFPHARLVSAAPGELMLLGSRAPSALDAVGLADRLRTPHVKRVLADCGMDWPVILTLAQLDEDALPAFVASRGTSGDPADSERLAHRLPIETMGWGPKQERLRTALVELASRWADELAHDETLVAELSTRTSDENKARQLQRQFPDEWWAYRTTLRRQLQSTPQTKVQQVSGGTTRLHPTDRARLDFLVDLGDAYGEQPPTLDSVRRVSRAVRHRDPLLTYFVHAEVARLLARCPTRDPAEELEHRLWLLFHGDPQDRSIRNVVAAAELILEFPEAVPAAGDRFDLLNGLLQQLATRWDARGRGTPLETHVAFKDAQLTLDAVEDVFDALHELSGKGVASEAAVRSRRGHLDERLVRPLKRYRKQLLAKRAADLRQVRKGDGEADAEPRTDDGDGPENDAAPDFDFEAEYEKSLEIDVE